MQMQQVSNNCYAVLNEKNRVCDANSGLINLDGGLVIDTQSDLAHAPQMIELFRQVCPLKKVQSQEVTPLVYMQLMRISYLSTCRRSFTSSTMGIQYG